MVPKRKPPVFLDGTEARFTMGTMTKAPNRKRLRELDRQARERR